jgi:hypothetical protein
MKGSNGAAQINKVNDMAPIFSVKVVKADGSFLWLVEGSRFTFTKSKCEFLINCAKKTGLFSDCNFEVVL